LGPGLTFRQAMGQWRFWLIAAVLLGVSFALAGPLPNMENILKTAGFGAGAIVKLTSLIGLSALCGRFVGGWLLDLFWAPAIGLVLFAVPSLSCYLLSQPSLSPIGATVSIVLIGFSVGVEYDLVAYMVARYFGMRAYTAIYGLLYVFFAIGAGLGPQVFGWSFDRTGDYHLILHVALAMLLIGGVALLALGRYRFARLDDPAAPLQEATVAAA
jgi:MFS family permease